MESTTAALGKTDLFLYKGLYDQHIEQWLKHFELGRTLHIVDGANLIARPWEEMEKVQDFLKLPREITRDSFMQNKNRRSYQCFKVGIVAIRLVSEY